MFAFKRPKVINKLTQLINGNPNVSVKEVLANEDLSPSIRNEVPELLDFFCPPLPTPPSPERQPSTDENITKVEGRQRILSKLAFTSELNKKEEDFKESENLAKYLRFNRNASNILSSPSKKFHDRLVYYYVQANGKKTPSPFLEELIKFANSMAKNPNRHHNPVFYGHFHRIFEAVIRSSKGQFFETLYTLEPSFKPFYNILLNKLNLTSIRQLYVTCASEFPHQFAGLTQDQDPNVVFVELSNFGKKNSEKIHGKKIKRIHKIHMKEAEYNDFLDKKKADKKYTVKKLDHVGREQIILDISNKNSFNKKHSKVDDTQALECSGKKRSKRSRADHFHLVVATLLAIRDIMNDSTEVAHYFRVKEVISNLLIIGRNLPELSFALSLAYSLILKIALDDNQRLSDFEDLLIEAYEKDRPNDKDIETLKNRIEKAEELASNIPDYACDHQIYQIPLYFRKLPDSLHELFFSKQKYSDRFDEQYIFSIKRVLSKEEQIQFFTQQDNKFLKGLCNALPEAPKIDLTAYNANATAQYELPSIMDSKEPPCRREPLRGHLWDIAKYINDEKHFTNDEIPFKKGKEWQGLQDKVNQYFKNVYAYVSEPTDEENDDIDNFL